MWHDMLPPHRFIARLRWRRWTLELLVLFWRPQWTVRERIEGFGAHLLAGVSSDEGPDWTDDDEGDLA